MTSSPSSTLTNLQAYNSFLAARALIEELVRQGVDTFFVAPGSRSSPLVAAIDAHPDTRVFVHFDERGASFAALGFGRGARRPAALVTTSGSAVANAFPAVVEASTDAVPLILITADRPWFLRQTGSNQTIDQVKIFGDYPRYHCDLAAPVGDPGLRNWIRAAAQAAVAARSMKGPAHLNCQFDEPLTPVRDGDTTVYIDPAEAPGISEWIASGAPWIRNVASTDGLDRSALTELAEALATSRRGLAVVGALPDPYQVEAAKTFTNHLGLPVLADPLSGLRVRGDGVRGLVVNYDQLLAVPRFAEGQEADLIIMIGGRLVSKILIQFIERSTAPCYQVMPQSYPFQPGDRPVIRVEGDLPAEPGVVSPADCDPLWFGRWMAADEAVGDLFDASLQGDPLAARTVIQTAGSRAAVFAGNSMPVRDIDRFGGVKADASIYANRGASGIDGNVATSVGLAAAEERPVVALLGDLTLLHDINSLALARGSEYPVIIVVVNNDGGGIFSFLPIARHDEIFEPYFGTPHGFDFAAAAAQFRLPHLLVTDAADLKGIIGECLDRGESTLIELRSSRDANLELHRQLTRLASEVLGQ